MIGADRIAAESLERLVATQAAGEDPRPTIIEVHRNFARNAAETWWLAVVNSSLSNHAEALRAQALRDQRDVVAVVNREYFIPPDRSFDRQCRRAVKEAFNERVRDLVAGVAR